MSAAAAYEALKAHQRRIYNLEHVQAIASWDRLTNMPPGAAAVRADAQGELASLIQKMRCDPELDELLARAGDEPLAADDEANLALMRRERIVAAAIPEDLVMRRSAAAGAAARAWAEAKAANDWACFAAPLAPLVDCVREQAERTGQALGIGRYDALLDGFDRGLRREAVEALFDGIAGWLPGMIAAVVAKQAGEPPPVVPQGPFDIGAQRMLCRRTLEMLGFDFDHGRLDESLHPFTGGTPEDVRLTTRYREDGFLPALLGLVHETGHARYQTNLPAAWRGQPLGEPCSASMHEAQALIFERQVGRTRSFASLLTPILSECFGGQPAFAPENMVRLLTRVRPGPIRTEADEVTYPAHVILRTRIEIALIEGGIEVGDIPALWDDGMQRLLGIDTRGDATAGPLQDVHWSQGMFGYFPAYLLGQIAAVQLFEAAPAAGEADSMQDPASITVLADWLRETVWSRGARLTSNELIREVTGAPLSGEVLRAHFQRKYALP